MAKGKKVTDLNQPSKDNLGWSDDMDLVLLNALTEEAMKGNRHDGSWTTEAYANVVKVLSLSIGPHITKQHIKNKMKTLKDHFAEAYDLFNSLSGFSWNPTTRRFEAEEDVWEDFIREKPYAGKWKKMQIKHYDMLKELFGADRATGKGVITTKERIKQWEREPIDLNDSFEAMGMPEIDVNIGNDTPFSATNLDSFSPTYGQSNQSCGTSASRVTKRKAHLIDLVETQYEKVAFGINALTDAMKDGKYILKRLHEVIERQVILAERQVSLAERQLQIAEKRLTILQQSKPRHYSESDVWDMLTEMGVLDPLRMRYYRFLCGNDMKKRELFGIPPDMRLEALVQMMAESGTQ